jgi:hypothetical protein
LQQQHLFAELSSILNKAGLLVNRVELTFPGKHAVLVCEVLSKTTRLAKYSKDLKPISSSELILDLEEVLVKLGPFVGNRKVLIRFT